MTSDRDSLIHNNLRSDFL